MSPHGSHGHALACDDCRELLGGYVLDALEPAEADAVREHLSSCADCMREHAALATLPSLLDAAGSADRAPAAQPPPALEDVVVSGFARERGAGAAPAAEAPRRRPARAAARRWFGRPLPVAIAAAAAAVLITLAVSTWSDDGSPATHTYGARLVGSAAAPSARAYAKLTNGASGTRVRLWVKGVRPEPGAVYQLWCIEDDGRKVSAGTFRVDARGRADVSLSTAARLGEYTRMSVERTAGQGAGERVLAGEVEY